MQATDHLIVAGLLIGHSNGLEFSLPPTTRTADMLFWKRRLQQLGLRVRVTLYGKPDCHLCDVAELAIKETFDDSVIDLEKVDIRGSASLMEAFGTEIPVVFVSGVKCFRHRVPKPGLTKRVKAAAVALIEQAADSPR